MPRDIPSAVPSKIRALIKDGWGDIQSFADANDLTYTEAYNMLVRSGARRALKLTRQLAAALKISREEASEIFFAEPGPERKLILERMAADAGLTLAGLSEICWGNTTYIYKLLTGHSSGKEVRRLIHLVKSLGLDQDSFEKLYDDNFVAA